LKSKLVNTHAPEVPVFEDTSYSDQPLSPLNEPSTGYEESDILFNADVGDDSSSLNNNESSVLKNFQVKSSIVNGANINSGHFSEKTHGFKRPAHTDVLTDNLNKKQCFDNNSNFLHKLGSNQFHSSNPTAASVDRKLNSNPNNCLCAHQEDSFPKFIFNNWQVTINIYQKDGQ